MAPGRGRDGQSTTHGGTVASVLTASLGILLLGCAPGAVRGDDVSMPTTGASGRLSVPGDHGPSNGPVMASFSTSFANVTQGQALNVSWSYIDPKYEPLSMTVRLINRTTETHANGFMVTLASRIYNTSSWTWPTVPYPLPFLDNGLYELEISPAVWNLSVDDASMLSVPVLARSSFFHIADQAGSTGTGTGTGSGTSTGSDNNSPNGTTTAPSSSRPGQLVTDTDHAPKGPNRVALALGLSLGLAGALALTAVLIFLRRRHRQSSMEAEKRRRRRYAYIAE